MHLHVKNYFGYAEALFEIAVSNNKVENFLNDSFFILDIIQSHPILVLVFNSYFVSNQEKFNLIDRIFSEKVEKLIINFLKLISKSNLFSHYKHILVKFIKLANMHLHQTWGEIETAFPISVSIISSFENILSNKLNKKVHLRQKINSELISGIRIIVDSQIFDNSIFSQLKLLKQTLKKQTKTKKSL
ncbi:ATP synthase F1 subunit delta [Mycoplasma flocculare]|uniref:ATP synthase subunit delta n=2 Tax=Mesomycoplasma flocculare TaxID=2128 RepID=A0A0A8E5Y9_MESFC|nr:F0F1 ATP synthase subunit delta [Mesomycoplasma flocculare]MXR39254.1 ATP synthase F1 subunit delta [Mycoplasma sp. MF12]AJC49625.1 F0F1 ATP synthase subunit delta [Mesomycoplasma flocculare ATCC 27399]ENX50838.1 ATP synthase delta chain [Mesomycoplasma flocculare ATCC 27716]MXR05668.1 ATP synthase F1 subunit delta [Mesomycoplasma flocculare]MXR12038.1 ATP synthase F1 subunit delta [Mesomycoplasma flocculare]